MSHQNLKTKSTNYNKQTSKRRSWLRSQKAKKKWLEHKSTKNNMNSELPKIITLLRLITRPLSISKILNLMIRLNSPKRISILPFYKPEGWKRKLTSAEMNSSVPNKHLTLPENKMICSWTPYHKSPGKSSTGKNSITKTKMKSKL